MNRLRNALLLCLIEAKVSAVSVTLVISDEVELSDGKLCVYENAQRSESAKVAKSAPCHHTKTFETRG